VDRGVFRLVAGELIAVGAVAADLEGSAAGAVTRGAGVAGVPAPPAGEQAERPGEFASYYVPEVAAVAILDEIGAGIRQLADGAGASVAGIGQRRGAGSGIVLGEGQVLTSAENVRGDQVTVTFAGGRTAEGTAAGHDIDSDLAVISVDTGEAPALP
jgi:S1-C subfamily serine protease